MAVFDHEFHVREVRVPVREVRSLQRHVVGARVGALHFRSAVKREVFFRVQLVADVGNRVARYGLLGSVILRGASVLLDRHNHFFRGRSDFQLAFGLFDCVVVRLRALVQRIGERVIALANIRPASRHVIRRAFVLRKAVSAANRHRVVRQRRAVVDLLIRSRGQRHLALLDHELAVFDLERHVREVRVDVREVRSLQRHVVGARVGALHFRSAVKREVFFRVQLVADVGNRVARYGLLGSVILRGASVLLDRHNHFFRGRSDFQLAFGLFDCVVVRLRALVQRIGERVIALANIRPASRHVIRRAFVLRKAVSAANRHRAVRQRRAVVDLLARARGQRHAALVDRQRTRIRRRNDILFCRVNLVQRITRFSFILFKIDRISSGIRSLPARFGNIVKGNVFLRAGVARFNRLLVSIISLLVAVRRQRDVLIIVEIDYVFVRVSLNCDRLGIIRYRRVALDRNGGFRHGFAERRSSFFRLCNFSLCSVQIIVYRVSGSVLFIVERQLALVFCEIDGLLFRVTIYKIERIEIFLQGIRRCDLFGFLPHKACHFIRMDQFFSIIIDIFDRINGRKLFNINRSVHVPCIRSRRHIIIRAIVNIEFRPCNFV